MVSQSETEIVQRLNKALEALEGRIEVLDDQEKNSLSQEKKEKLLNLIDQTIADVEVLLED